MYEGGVIIKGAFLKRAKIRVVGGAKVYIGPKTMMDDCTLIASGDNSIISIEGGSTNIHKSTFIANQECGKIIIGHGFTSEGSDIKAHEGKTIIIGRDCIFSSGINISTTDYHSIISIADNNRINEAKDITIGNHVWLGRNVSVLKGVTIADDIVVGMGSVVTKILHQPNAIYVGTPAAKAKNGIGWIREMI